MDTNKRLENSLVGLKTVIEVISDKKERDVWVVQVKGINQATRNGVDWATEEFDVCVMDNEVMSAQASALFALSRYMNSEETISRLKVRLDEIDNKPADV